MTEKFVLVGQARGQGLFGIEACLTYRKLEPGQALIIQREKDNPVHSNAVRIHLITGSPICYLDRVSADVLAPLMDAGDIFTCNVVSSAVFAHDPKKGHHVCKQPARVRIEKIPPDQLIMSDGEDLLEHLRAAGFQVLVFT